MKFIKLFIALPFILALNSCQKDPDLSAGSRNFKLAFGEHLETSGNASAITTSGAILSVGTQISPNNSSTMLYLQKCNSAGQSLWEKTYGGEKNEIGADILLNPDGTIMILGHTASFGAGLNDIYIVKTDENGNIIWEKTIGGPANDFARKIKPAANNHFYIGGYTQSYGKGGLDFYLAKIDALGNLIWQKTYGDVLDDGLVDFYITENGELMLFGFTNNYETEEQDFLLIKTDPNGGLIWQKTYGGFSYEEPQAISRCADGNFVLAGHTASLGDLEHDVYVIKVDLEGEVIWQKTCGIMNHHEGAMNVLASNSGLIYVLARGHHIDNAYLYKLNPEGELLNMNKFGGEKFDILYGIVEHSNSLILTGFTESYSKHPEKKTNLFLVKTDK